MNWIKTSKRIELKTNRESYLISDLKQTEFVIIHNNKPFSRLGFKMILAKYLSGNFSIMLDDSFFQSFSGDYFFYLYANEDYSKYVLSLCSVSFVLNSSNRGIYI